MSSAADRAPRKRRASGPDPIATDSRRARRRQKLPADAACADCGFQTPDLLLRAGCNLLEADHTDGHANDPDLVGPLCPTHHAVHSEAQRRLGVDLRHDESRSLLERRAAGLRSRATFFRQLAEAELRDAERLAELVTALDLGFPAWRDLPEAKAR
jgi:hypothetical protein